MLGGAVMRIVFTGVLLFVLAGLSYMIVVGALQR